MHVTGSEFFSMAIGLMGTSVVAVGILAVALHRRSKVSTLRIASQVAPQGFDPNREERLKEIKKRISKVRYLENVGTLGEKAAIQLEQISDRSKGVDQVLLSRFNPGEITFARYQTAADQAFLAVLDQLDWAATALNTMDSMKSIESMKSMKSTKSVQDPSGDLNERQDLRDQQRKNIEEILKLNEQAITELDRLSTALNAIQTRSGESSVGLKDSIEELTELANRAKKYTIEVKK
jgi:hypothetical protein